MTWQDKPENLLSLLDRRFSARIRVAELPGLSLSVAQKEALFRKGILSACRPDDVDCAPCPLDDHDDDGMVTVQKERDGHYRGLCKEHGQIVTIKAEDAEWVDFDPVAWARAVRALNNVKGDFTTDPREIFPLGALKHKRRTVEVCVVSGSAPVGAIAQMRPSEGGDLLLCIDLGNRVSSSWPAAKDRQSINAVDVFQDDMLALRDSALADAMQSIPQKTTTSTKPFLKYTGTAKPASLTEEQYLAESNEANKKRQHLFIDLSKIEAWRDGVRISKMHTKATKKKSKKQSKRPVSENGLKIVAHYLKRPGVPCAPVRTDPYADKKTTATSAQVAFNCIRKALNLAEVLPRGETVDGVRQYSFQRPPGFKCVLLTRVEEPVAE